MPSALLTEICALVFSALTNAMTATSIAVAPNPFLGVDTLGASNFDQYVETFERKYGVDAKEYSKRRSIFERNIKLIQAQNSIEQRLWTAGTNHLTDRTDEELAQLRGWKRTGSRDSKRLSLVGQNSETLRDVDEEELPESVDWAQLENANKVPDQGSCGSCWAVATAAMLQFSYQAQMNGSSRTFSAQQLVSCTPNEKDCGGTGGCDGATVELAMEYIVRKGLQDASASGIPYEGTDKQCPTEHRMEKSSSSKERIFLQKRAVENDNVARQQFGLQQWRKLDENKAAPVYMAVLEGPVAVSVAASDWYLYSHGVFDGCSKDAVIDHAVTLFGYGSDKDYSGKTTGYWKLRNSWGRHWGESGYIRLFRHQNMKDDEAYCGIDHNPKDGTACKPYPDQVEVCGMCGLFYDTVAVKFGPN